MVTGREAAASRWVIDLADRLPPRLIAVTDDATLKLADFDARLEWILRAGCPAVILRGRQMPGRAFFEAVDRAAPFFARLEAELWISERVDVALAVQAQGLQIPEGGLSITGARKVLGNQVRLGRSVHSVEGALEAAADGADHLVLGTIFATASHPGLEPAGLDLLREVRVALEARALEVPIFAIGGMTPERVRSAIDAGAHGVVALGAIWRSKDPAGAIDAFVSALGRGREEGLD